MHSASFQVGCPGWLRRGVRQLSSQMNDHHAGGFGPGHTEPGLQAGWHLHSKQKAILPVCTVLPTANALASG